MNFITPEKFTGDKAWDALPIAEIEGASVKLHWTDQPYIWHANDGDEVFVVLEGEVTMKYKRGGKTFEENLTPGMICHAETGDEHVAHPIGVARVLVIEKIGSV